MGQRARNGHLTLSTAPFDGWFEQQAGEIRGVDFNSPVPALPAQVLAWQAR